MVRRVVVLALAVAVSACNRLPRSPSCPAQQPGNGDHCDDAGVGVMCEYGGDAFGRNTALANCGFFGGHLTWSVGPSNVVEPNAAGCPATYAGATAQSVACPTGFACDYDEGRCACVCGGGPATWQCRARTDVPSAGGAVCTANRPLAGDACSGDETCDYNDGGTCGWRASLSLGPLMVCVDGYWKQMAIYAGGGCPSGC